MNESDFSKKFLVRRLNGEYIDQIYSLCKGNTLYYQFCPPFVTKESIAEDLNALPPGIQEKQKYYVGYFKEDSLVAVMDLIDGYPEPDIVFIGFFMCSRDIQKQGVGTVMIQELISYIKTKGYKSVRLAWVKGNPQAKHFWTKNGVVIVKETFADTVNECVILAEYEIR